VSFERLTIARPLAVVDGQATLSAWRSGDRGVSISKN
jgi:hypothetical protein